MADFIHIKNPIFKNYILLNKKVNSYKLFKPLRLREIGRPSIKLTTSSGSESPTRTFKNLGRERRRRRRRRRRCRRSVEGSFRPTTTWPRVSTPTSSSRPATGKVDDFKRFKALKSQSVQLKRDVENLKKVYFYLILN